MVNFINLQLKLEGIDEATQFDFITINRNAALVHFPEKKKHLPSNRKQVSEIKKTNFCL